VAPIEIGGRERRRSAWGGVKTKIHPPLCRGRGGGNNNLFFLRGGGYSSYINLAGQMEKFSSFLSAMGGGRSPNISQERNPEITISTKENEGGRVNQFFLPGEGEIKFASSPKSVRLAPERSNLRRKGGRKRFTSALQKESQRSASTLD